MQVVVERRYNGPPESGNGGWSCGVFAGAFGDGPAEVTLRRPPPLEVPLRAEDGAVYDGDALVAEVTAADLADVAPPPSPGWEAARAAEAGYAGLVEHPFPTCFACGTARADGLGLRPGPLDGLVATTWTNDGDDPTLAWAALDCPSGWALGQAGDAPFLLGRLAVAVERPLAPGPYVVIGWERAPREGRKRFAGSALYDATGRLVATGRATWVQVGAS